MLTDEEIDLLYGANCGDGGPTDVCEKFARAVEAAVLAKLAAAEMSEPVVIGRHKSSGLAETGYTEAQLREYGAACAAKKRAALMQLFTDPENQPTQYGTVLLSTEPVAIRYDFDGYGWMYYDNGSTSNWFEIGMKKPNAEPLYTRSTA